VTTTAPERLTVVVPDFGDVTFQQGETLPARLVPLAKRQHPSLFTPDAKPSKKTRTNDGQG